MQARSSFSCFLIGNDSLLMECGDLLLARSQELRGVVTHAPRVRAWAKRRGLEVIATQDAERSWSSDRPPFDWLISIANLDSIPSRALAAPTCGAVHFHDGPLPEYAGPNGPVRAIAQGEAEYGICWQLLTGGDEANSIVLRKDFQIAAAETAISLNARCFEAGLVSFGELIDRLATGQVQREAPTSASPSQNAAHPELEADGLLDWRKSAAELERLVRALDHGPYPNPLTTAKICHDKCVLIATRAELADGEGAPGRVLAADHGGVTIACGKGALRVTAVRDLCGVPLTPIGAFELLGARVGEILRGPDQVERARLRALFERTVPHEAHWAERLHKLQWPSRSWHENGRSTSPGAPDHSVTLPPELMALTPERRVAAVLGVHGVALARLCNQTSMSFWFGSDDLDRALGEQPHLHSPRSLLTLPAAAGADFAGVCAGARSELDLAREEVSWASDLLARQPGIRRSANLIDAGEFAPAVELRDDLSHVVAGDRHTLTLAIAADGSAARLVHDRTVISDEAAARVRGALETLLKKMLEQPEVAVGNLDSKDESELGKTESAGARGLNAAASTVGTEAMEFGLFVWGSDDAPGAGKYELLMEAARFGDAHGFSSISMPERHFHAFGGPYPNPAVTGAAVAAVTKRIGIRSGSSVSPLHHPLRLAEEWAVLDNLSDGRVGLGIASGWWPEDFVLRPESFADKKDRMQRDLEVVRRLWRGESVEFPGPDGVPIARQSLPRPVQSELPVWITSAGNPETFVIAGHMNAHVLTHLLGQSVEEVADKILLYRRARAEVGLDPAAGIVTLMLHTCIGDDVEAVREAVRGPLKGYLASATMLVKKAAWNFPAFRRPDAPDAGLDDIDIDALTGDEVNAVLEHAFERYFSASGLFGTPESVQPMIERLKTIGVNEIGCLIDFGLPTGFVIEHLTQLDHARRLANPALQPAELAGAVAPAPGSDAAKIAILDPHGHVQPIGVAGEVFATDQASGGRMHATGRRARLRSDGILENLGRTDRQIDLRGQVVNPSKVAAALAALPEVHDAVVVVDVDPNGMRQLIAYYTANGTPSDSKSLAASMRAHVTEGEVPAHFIRIDEIPLTPSGEADLRTLPAPESMFAAEHAEEEVVPSGELQMRIAKSWRRVLGRERVGARDNFFDIGGHSLLMLRLQLLLREELGRPVALTDLYRFPTVQGLADWLESDGSDDGALAGSAERAQQRRESLQRRRPRGV